MNVKIFRNFTIVKHFNLNGALSTDQGFKQGRTRWRNLIKLGINKYKAWEWANTRKGYWHIANSYILHRSVTIDRLKQAGFVFLSDYYRSVRVII